MPGIPPSLETDSEDVTWALQTAEALWKRNERADALVWLRRAAQAAGEGEHDDRALELADTAAQIAEWIGSNSPSARSHADAGASLGGTHVGAEHVLETQEDGFAEEVSVEVALESDGSLPSMRELADTPTGETQTPPFALEHPHVLTAAQKHAGMLDPWAADGQRHHVPVDEAPTRRPPPLESFDADEVVTSVPHVLSARTEERQLLQLATTEARPWLASNRLDLSSVDALTDLPDEQRDALARAAVVRELACNEELTGFALALILEGSVDLAATIVDTPAQRLDAGAVVRARGTLDHAVPLRLVAASDGVRVGTWDERAVAEAFRTCTWVEDDLRVAGDRLQALVGVTMGPLGEHFDPTLRAQVMSKLTLRALAEHEVFAVQGKPVPGLFVVGAGELEFVGEDGLLCGKALRAGDFLFPNEVLRAGPAPSTVRAARGGALVLFADRHAAQELLVTCPPLLEIFAGS